MLTFLTLNAQKELKILKIDKSDYPETEILVKMPNPFDKEKLKIFENGKKTEFTVSTVPLKEIKKDKRILFLINKKSSENILKFIAKEIEKLGKNDEINVGIITSAEDKRFIRFASPEFSKNHFFFNEFLLRELKKEFPESENCRNLEKFAGFLFSEKDDFDNTGIFIFSEEKDFSFKFCPDFEKKRRIPVYFLQTGNINPEKEQKIIKYCTETGGMYAQSFSEKESQAVLSRFKEDLSYVSEATKPELIRIKLKIKNTGKHNKITVSYNDDKDSIIIQKPTAEITSTIEKFLPVFIILLNFLFFMMLFCCLKFVKKKNKKQNLPVSGISKKSPIEINIKGKGFDKTYFFEKQLISIGRGTNNDVVIPDLTVSGKHAVISKEDNDFYIRDLGSTNGIKVKKKKVKKYKLKQKDTVKLGAVVLYVKF